MNNDIFLLLFALAFIFTTIIIGVYVYNDSKSRNMNTALWTVITIITSHIGFIIYLIVRKNNFVSNCSNCNHPINIEWKFCPNCSANLSSQNLYPNYKKDNKLKWVITSIIIIPLLVLSAGIFNVKLLSKTSLSGNISSINHMDIADVKTQEVKNWIKKCNKQGKDIYILKISDSQTIENYYKQYSKYNKKDLAKLNSIVYIYINKYDKELACQNIDFFKETMNLNFSTEITEKEANNNYELTFIEIYENDFNNFEIFVDGLKTASYYEEIK